MNFRRICIVFMTVIYLTVATREEPVQNLRVKRAPVQKIPDVAAIETLLKTVNICHQIQKTNKDFFNKENSPQIKNSIIYKKKVSEQSDCQFEAVAKLSTLENIGSNFLYNKKFEQAFEVVNKTKDNGNFSCISNEIMFITSDSLIIRANLTDSSFGSYSKDLTIDKSRLNFSLNNAIYAIKEIPTSDQVQKIKDKQCNYRAREYMEEAFNMMSDLKIKSYFISFDNFIKKLDIGQYILDNLKSFASLDITGFLDIF